MNKTWLLVTFSLLWILDTAFTVMFVTHSGFEAEANPLLRYVLEHTGITGLVAVKVATLAPVVAIHKTYTRTWVDWAFAALILIMVPVVYMGAVVGFQL